MNLRQNTMNKYCLLWFEVHGKSVQVMRYYTWDYATVDTAVA